MSGSYFHSAGTGIPGFIITGSVITGSVYAGIDDYININSNRLFDNLEELWERMYIRPRPVIIVCGFCKSHNAVTNPTCIQCGAPMGLGIERVFG